MRLSTAGPDVLVDITPLGTLSRFQGIGTYVRELERALAGLGTDELCGLHVGALVGFDDGRPQIEALSEGRPFEPGVTALHADSRGYLWRRRLLLGQALRRSGARLVHLPEPLGMPVGSGVSRVVTCHDLIPLQFPKWYLSRRFPLARPRRWLHDRLRFGTARRVMADSKATARDLISTLRIPESRIDIVYPGIDLERFRPQGEIQEKERLRALFGLDRPYLLYVGAGDPRKGIVTLMRAHSRVASSHDLLLVLAGRIDSHYQPALETAIREHGRSDLIRCLGFVPPDTLPALYRQCHVFAFPSHAEGFGLPLAEAMACGAPSVASSAGSLPEVAGDGALLVRAGDDEALASEVARLADDTDLRRRLAARGPSVASQFTWVRCARGVVACYLRALGMTPGSAAAGTAERGPAGSDPLSDTPARRLRVSGHTLRIMAHHLTGYGP